MEIQKVLFIIVRLSVVELKVEVNNLSLFVVIGCETLGTVQSPMNKLNRDVGRVQTPMNVLNRDVG